MPVAVSSGTLPAVRQAALGEADLLILPVNDWKDIKNIHFQMAAFRAIEAGLPPVRAAASGLSTAFDPWGRVLGVADYFASGDHTLTVQVPIGGVRTLYGHSRARGHAYLSASITSVVDE